jgi:ankyrin repeat protein
MLLEKGADAERANDRGQTALAAAAFKGAVPVIEALLGHGAAVDGSGHDGRTALMVAAMFDRLEIVDLLLAHGADPDRQDAGGFTAEAAALKMGATRTPARLAALRAAGGRSA